MEGEKRCSGEINKKNATYHLSIGRKLPYKINPGVKFSPHALVLLVSKLPRDYSTGEKFTQPPPPPPPYGTVPYRTGPDRTRPGQTVLLVEKHHSMNTPTPLGVYFLFSFFGAYIYPCCPLPPPIQPHRQGFGIHSILRRRQTVWSISDGDGRGVRRWRATIDDGWNDFFVRGRTTVYVYPFCGR